MGDGNATLRFYYPLPVFGQKMARQWPKFREDFQNLAPLVRAAYIDLQPSSMHDPGENDLAGWAIGERDFRNRWRTWYSKTEDMFKIQYNVGTEDVPAWVDAMQIRNSDLRVTITGPGGIAAPTGGFYTDIPRQLAITQNFPLSSEWQFQHNLNTVPLIWDTFRSNNISVVPAKVDVGNPNIAYFYFSSPVEGKAIAVGGQARGNGINFTDGTNIYYNKLQLNANSDDFYFSRNLQGNPVLNLQPIDISNIDTSLFVRTDGVNPFIANQSMGGNKLTNVGTPTAGGDAANKTYVDAAKLDVTDSFGSVLFTDATKLTFEGASFYLRADSSGQPTVNFRGTAGGSGGTFGSGVKSQDFTAAVEWQFHHNLGVTGVVWGSYDDQGDAIIPDKVSTHNTNIAYFYFTTPVAGRAVVIGGPTVGVNVSDTVETFQAATTVKFNPDSFYLTSDSSGNPMVNFSGTAGGGGGGLNNVVEDLTPQLGGNLDVNFFEIRGTDSATVADGGDVQISGGDSSGGGRGGSVNLTGGNGASTGSINLNGSNLNVSVTSMNLTGDNITFSATNPIDAGTQQIANLVDPSNPQDAATKAYVDAQSGGGGGGGGFYGIVWSDGVNTKRTDRLSFSNSDFYLDGFKPTLNIKPIFTSKAYVDAGDLATIQATGPGFYGLFVKESRVGATVYRNDTLIFDSGAFYINPTSIGKPMVSIRSNPGISSVSADPAPVLSAALNAGGFQITNVADPTSAQGAATKNYVDINMTSGFYGIFIKESRAGATTYKKDTIIFDSGAFYINPTSIGQPMISVRSNPGIASVVQDTSPVLGGNLNAGGFRITNLGAPTAATDAVRFGDLSPGFYGIFIRETDGNPPTNRNDTITFDSSSFYIQSDSKGKPIISLRSASSGAISGIDSLDGVHAILNKSKVNYNPGGFYLSQTTAGDPMVNLRYDNDIYPIFIELGSIQNVIVDPFAQYSYTIDRADLDCRSGSATGGFYIIPAIQSLGIRVGRGQPIGNMDQLAITTVPKRVLPTTNKTVNPGDAVLFTVFGNSTAKHIRVSLVTKKP
jgi:hypothetical protein